jgi:hypothetical protein
MRLIDKGQMYDVELTASVASVFEAMDEGERCHMANKLFKEGYIPIRQQNIDAAETREWDILESACDFWKDEAVQRGYQE